MLKWRNSRFFNHCRARGAASKERGYSEVNMPIRHYFFRVDVTFCTRMKSEKQ